MRDEIITSRRGHVDQATVVYESGLEAAPAGVDQIADDLMTVLHARPSLAGP